MRLFLSLLLLTVSLMAGEVKYVTLSNGYKVWTETHGSGPIKMLLLHGGPGFTHEYFEGFLDHFPADQYQIIFYDQLGSYHSDQPNDPSLWTVERFTDEVEEVRKALGLDNYILLGQSWGGLLAIEYALKYPQHLKKVIFSNITGSVASYIEYLNELRRELPEEIQDKLAYFEDRQEFHHPEYEKTMFEELYNKHLCRVTPWPEPLLRAFSHFNTSVYETIQGPNEFVVTGNFKDWNRWDDLHKIKVPTLVISGKYDTMGPGHVTRMASLIPNSTLKICENGSHCTMWDDPENYFPAIKAFINK